MILWGLWICMSMTLTILGKFPTIISLNKLYLPFIHLLPPGSPTFHLFIPLMVSNRPLMFTSTHFYSFICSFNWLIYMEYISVYWLFLLHNQVCCLCFLLNVSVLPLYSSAVRVLVGNFLWFLLHHSTYNFCHALCSWLCFIVYLCSFSSHQTF